MGKICSLILALCATVCHGQANFSLLAIEPRAAAGGGAPTVASLSYSNNLAARWVANSLSLSDGDPISTWTDVSTGGKNVTAAGGARPTFKTSIVNGKAVARFDNSDDKMGFSTIGPLTDFTVFIVFQTTGDNIIIGKSDFTSQFRVGVSGNDILSIYDGASQADSSTLGGVRANWNLAVYKRASGEVFFWLNGVAKSSSFAFSNMNLDTFGVSPINGDVAEICVFTEAMSDGNRQGDEDALGTFYGITITH